MTPTMNPVKDRWFCPISRNPEDWDLLKETWIQPFMKGVAPGWPKARVIELRDPTEDKMTPLICRYHFQMMALMYMVGPALFDQVLQKHRDGIPLIQAIRIVDAQDSADAGIESEPTSEQLMSPD